MVAGPASRVANEERVGIVCASEERSNSLSGKRKRNARSPIAMPSLNCSTYAFHMPGAGFLYSSRPQAAKVCSGTSSALQMSGSLALKTILLDSFSAWFVRMTMAYLRRGMSELGR